MIIMTIKGLIEEDGGKLGVKQIRAVQSGLMKELTCTKVQVGTDACDLLNRLLSPIPLIITKACLLQFESSLLSKRHKIFQTIKAAGIPCLALADTMGIPDDLVRFSTIDNLPIFSSIYDEHLLESRMLGLLREKIDKIITFYGVLVDCAGVGVLISGESGIGKTRCAVRLVERGHWWVADDCVEIEKRAGNVLYGHPHHLIANLLELKPLGIVSAMDLFGASSISPETIVAMILEFNRGKNNVKKDRPNTVRNMHNIMGVELPFIKLSGVHNINSMADTVESFVSAYLTERNRA